MRSTNILKSPKKLTELWFSGQRPGILAISPRLFWNNHRNAPSGIEVMILCVHLVSAGINESLFQKVTITLVLLYHLLFFGELPDGIEQFTAVR